MDEKNITSILIIRPDAIGDCVLITPAIKALKNRFPNATISVLAQELTRDIFATNPDVTEVLTDIKQIKTGKYDLSIHYYNELPYALAAKRAKIKYRLGDPSKFPVGLFYNLKYRQNWRDITKHDVEQNMLLLKPLGIEPPYPKLELQIEPQALQKVKTLLEQVGIHPKDQLVGLQFSTGKGNKPWLPQNFAVVAKYLVKKGFKVVATGREQDHLLIHEAQKSTPGTIIDLTMRTSLRELIALTSLYKLFIGVDTGPFHIAAALKIPIVHLSTSKFSLPLRWGPWQDRHILLRKRSICDRFCLPANCQELICADEIQPNEVIKAIEILLQGGGNLTQSEAFFDWCHQCFSIMIAYRPKNIRRAEEIYQALHHQGFFAVMIDLSQKQDFPKLFKQHNINIVHAVDNQFKLKLAALTSGQHLITPALYVKDDQDYNTGDELFKLYCHRFAASKV
jgi:ADP-heptose:LPS heptosyltransferase